MPHRQKRAFGHTPAHSRVNPDRIRPEKTCVYVKLNENCTFAGEFIKQIKIVAKALLRKVLDGKRGNRHTWQPLEIEVNDISNIS